MEALFLRILAFILSVLMFVFNSIASVFPGILPDDPVENNAYVYDAELFELDGNEVIDDYVSWYKAGGRNFDEFDWKYFFTKSVAAVKVTLPDPGYTIEEISAAENGDTLEVSYKLFSGDGEYAAVECSKVIIIETSKNVKLIDVSEEKVIRPPLEPDDPEIPEEPEIVEGNSYGIYSADNFNDDYKHDRSYEVISSYDEWYYYYEGGTSDLYKYDREYFENRSLAIIYVSVPFDGKAIKIYNIAEDEKYLRVRYRVMNGESELPKGACAVVIETSKNIQYVSLTQVGSTSGYAFVDYTMLNPDYMPSKEHGSYEIVRSISSYLNLESSSFNSSYYINKDFFEDTNLAAIYIMLPNANHSVMVSSFEENGNTLEIEYTTEDLSYDQRCEIVEYIVMFAEISKNITEVKLTETENNKNIFKTYDYFKAMGTEEGLVVSDYATWTEVGNINYAPFAKYDEEYFETRSLVLLSGTLPDSGAYFDVIKVKENGNTLDLVYGIYSRGGLTMLTYKTLLIEVSKDITTVSAQRKDQSCYYNTLSAHNFKLSDAEKNSAVLIASYANWQGYLAANPSSKLDKYNREYFKTKSVALCNVVLPGGASEAVVRYLYTEGDTLHVGINKHDVYGVAGLTALVPKTVVVEVEKAVTQIEYEILY